MRSFLIAIAGLLLFASTAAQAKVEITVDKDNQIMTVAVDGVARYHWPVSTGIPSRETPNGTFRTFRMEASHFSKEFDDAPMPHGCVRLSRANATTLYALVEEQGVLNTTVTLTGSSTVALARHPRPNTAVARRAPAPSDDDQQYAAGEPVQLAPQAQTYPNQAYPNQAYAGPQQYYPNQQPMPPQRADDGYIYPADGSSNAQIYPAPPGTRRQLYDAQAYPQPQSRYYNDPNAAPPPPPQGYYNQQPRYYQPRGFSQD
jgi:hypothetical protein